MQTFQALAPIVAWLLVIGGWILVRHDNNARENRHELRSKIDDMIKDIQELEISTHEYYMANADDKTPLAQVAIKRKQTSLEKRVNRLKTSSVGFQDLKTISDYRNELTGGDFEQLDRRAKDSSNKKMMEISLAASALIDYLESEYERLYIKKPVKKP